MDNGVHTGCVVGSDNNGFSLSEKSIFFDVPTFGFQVSSKKLFTWKEKTLASWYRTTFQFYILQQLTTCTFTTSALFFKLLDII